ncbi:hypothetical protein HOG21_00560 [bacterium]|nr:hypothetical protein [bacterium]
MSSQNNTKNGSSPTNGLDLRIASPSHLGYGCLTYTIFAIELSIFTFSKLSNLLEFSNFFSNSKFESK